MTRLKLAELTSGVGALVLGVGLGALFPQWFAPAAAMITAAGVIVHSVGMWDKHRIEARAGTEGGPCLAVLYWVCWSMLAALVIVLFVRA
jgi:hypothetical protein